jgi:hypothetical protein
MDVANGFLQERKKERKKGMKEKKRKERHLIRAAAPALSFEDGWSLRRICIAQVSNRNLILSVFCYYFLCKRAVP